MTAEIEGRESDADAIDRLVEGPRGGFGAAYPWGGAALPPTPLTPIEGEELLRLLAEQAEECALVLLDRAGRVARWNAGAQRVAGYRAEEIVGRHLAHFYPAEDIADGKPARALAAAARDGRMAAEAWWVRKDGGRFWAEIVITALRDAAGRPRGFAAVTRDLTERRQAERALREERDLLAALLDTVGALVVVLDEAGRVVCFNRACAAMTGCPAEEARGRPLGELPVPPEQVAPLRALVECARAGRAPGRHEHDWPTRAGGRRRIAWTTAALRDAGGAARGVIAVGHDLTEQRRLEAERAGLLARERAAQARAEAARRERDAVIQLAAHELRTPLTLVSGHLQLLGRRLRAPEWDRAAVLAAAEQLHAQLARVERLAADLLEAAPAEDGPAPAPPAPLDLAALARAALARCERAPGRTPAHRLTLEAPASVRGRWDPDRLERALSDLVAGALQRSPDGGEVRVTVRAAAGGAEVAVRDEGPGLTPEERARLFWPSARAGAGLWPSARLAARYGGALAVESAPGAGVTVTLRLPPAGG